MTSTLTASRRTGRIGLHGRVRVTVREPSGLLVAQRVFDNMETNYALNSVASWLAGGGGVVAPAAASYIALGTGYPNLLSANQSGMEGTPTGWEASTNCTVAQSTAHVWQGLYSLAMTASGSGTMIATTTPGAAAVAVSPSQAYAASAHFFADSATRSVSVNIAWYDASGVLISTSTGTASTDSASAWKRVYVLATSPSNAAFAAVQAQVAGASSSEIHYVDGAQLEASWDGPSAWLLGGQTVSVAGTDTQIVAERYLTRAHIDTAFTQTALAAMLHTYQTTDPSGTFAEAGLFDGAVSTAKLDAQANAGDTTLTVQSSSPAVAAGTQIFIASQPLAAPAAPTFSGESTTGGHLVGGTTYYYKLTALSAIGETIPGAEGSYTMATADGTTGQVTLDWTAVPDATGYKVYRGTASGGELLLATVGAVTSYVDNTNTTPSGNPPTADTSGGQGEYATIAAAAAAGATSWTLTDNLLSAHPATYASGTSILATPVTVFAGANLWAHVTLTNVSKTGTQLLSVQWEIICQAV